MKCFVEVVSGCVCVAAVCGCGVCVCLRAYRGGGAVFYLDSCGGYSLFLTYFT